MNQGIATLLYPQILSSVARTRAESICRCSLHELEDMSELSPSGVTYTPTGGSRIEEHHLEKLRQGIRQKARALGYPDTLNAQKTSLFDSGMAEWLHQHMDIRPSEASRQGVWSYMGLYLVPEMARWRFPGDDVTSIKRFLGSTRGMRNVLGRLWWRAEYLKQPETFRHSRIPSTLDQEERYLLTEDPYGLVKILGEDELVGITERPTLAGNRVFCRAVTRALVIANEETQFGNRSFLLREAMKRVYRLGGVMVFEALSETELVDELLDVFTSTAATLKPNCSGATP